LSITSWIVAYRVDQTFKGAGAPQLARFDIERLLDTCSRYAAANSGHYPADQAALGKFMEQEDQSPSLLDKFLYCGEGLPEDLLKSQDPRRDNDHLIVFISNGPLANGKWAVGLKGNPPASRMIQASDAELPAIIAECNATRSKLGLATIDFQKLIGRPLPKS